MKAIKLAVIGKDVSKSLSPQMHTFIAERTGNRISYEKISVSEELFESSVEKYFTEYDGFNVTIPYKISVMPYLKSVEGDARVFGAVNTVRTRDRSGHNTDGLGFALMLLNAGVDVKDRRVLILGAGGAGRSVAKKLADAGAEVFIFDRNTHKAEAVAKVFGVVALPQPDPKPYFAVVNATGVGMHQTEGVSPVGAELLKKTDVAVDLIYEPAKSRFLEIAESLGKKIINGGAMLFYQAYFAQRIYFGEEADAAQAKKLYEEFREEYL